MKRVLMFVGSRANFGRLKMVIDELLERGHKVDIVEGSYELPDKKYYDLVKLKADNLMFRDTVHNMVTSMSLVALAVSCYLANKKHYYDVAIVHADRFENLGFAVACSYINIPILHTEGGEISGNIDNKIRYAISALADIHCTAYERALDRVSDLCLYKENTGSPAIDYVASLKFHEKKASKDYVLVLFNPADNEDSSILGNAICEIVKDHKVVWVNSNFDPGTKLIAKIIHGLEGIKFRKNLSPEQYYGLLYNAKLLIGNTSSGIKEGAYLGVPYLLVGDRQKQREVAGNVVHVDLITNDIIYAAKEMLSSKTSSFGIGYFGEFGDGTASKKIVDVIEGVC